MKYGLIYRLADADNNSKWYGSAAQAQAQQVADLIIERSWCDDDAQLEGMNEYIAIEYTKLINLLK